MTTLLEKYFASLPAEKLQRLHSLFPLYEEWNNKINLISRKDFNKDIFYERHLIHSLSILKAIEIPQGSKIIDVGTGGGFPGIPLAIVLDEVEFTLLDSKQKKIKVINEIAATLNLKNVKTIWDRIENVKEKFDFVTGRAVKDLSLFFSWTKKNLKNENSRIIYLTGGEIPHDFVNKTGHFKEYELKNYFEEPFFETKKIVIFN